MADSKVALVTGGAGAIGGAIVRALAEAGQRVAVADLSLDVARGVAKDAGGLAVELSARRCSRSILPARSVSHEPSFPG
jgi:NAD(P)-dependent dehydrogenase (short-subunit alcohol dehydrogenase family)